MPHQLLNRISKFLLAVPLVKLTQPKGDLVPFVGLSLSNCFVSLSIMDDVISQENYTMHNVLDKP